MAIDGNANIYITGIVAVATCSWCYQAAFTLKYDAAGIQQWVDVYSNPNGHGDAAMAIAVNNNNEVFVAGETMAPNSGLAGNYSLIKYCQSSNCSSNIDEIKNTKTELELFPNPATGCFTLNSNEELGSIIMRNCIGEIVYQTRSKNTQEQIDISKLPAGVYMIQAQNKYVKLIKE